MITESFLDTNVLVYAATSDAESALKRERALELIETVDFALSAQVLQEFYVTVTRKLEIPLSADQALGWIEQFEAFCCVAVDTALVKVAAEISERYRISYWDGAILAAAELAGADTLYTEDLNDGQRYGSVRVINPFDEAAGRVQQPGSPYD
ncbi:MAG: PIN domain-containing protein [Xanthomonadales bacterium]|nr:PIN domain-containing protein [Xanthomonadales bacterium]